VVQNEVTIKKRVLKGLQGAPIQVLRKFDLLLEDLRQFGPKQPNWPNYSPIGLITYHCHLNCSWVACWRHENGTIEIEVYYAGSREDAPY
jgi:hypothetical protein